MAYSALPKDELAWYQKLLFNIITQGPFPKHIAFILDGNRRYAKKVGLKTKEGHKEGFENLQKVLSWSIQLGIKEITGYVFSIENFKRQQEEVDDIFQLLEEQFTKLLHDKTQLKIDGICYQFIGELSLLPLNVKKIICQLMVETRYYSRLRANIALAYTSRNEIARGVEIIHGGVNSGELLLEDINQDLLAQTFQILPNGYPVDLLIRTSGENRLSDFLLWQSTECMLYFTDVLWPEFTAWTLLSIIFEYQRNYFMKKKLKFAETTHNKAIANDQLERQTKFINKYRDMMWDDLERGQDNKI